MAGLLSLLAACSASVAEPTKAPPAQPAPPQVQNALACDYHDVVLKQLAERFAERVVGRAISWFGALVEVLAAPDGVTWSIIVTRPDGWTCLVASGEHWQRLRLEASGTAI